MKQAPISPLPAGGLCLGAAADFTCATGEVRYLAANGDDGNDGKSPETARRSVARLNAGPSVADDLFAGQLRQLRGQHAQWTLK